MFGAKNEKATKTERNLETIIGKGTEIEGNMVVKSSILINGKIIGKIDSTDTVRVGSSGFIQGDIFAKNAIIGGSVEGTVQASGKVVLGSTSKLIGNLSTTRLIVEEGGVLDGKCDMKQPMNRVEKKTGQPSERVMELEGSSKKEEK